MLIPPHGRVLGLPGVPLLRLLISCAPYARDGCPGSSRGPDLLCSVHVVTVLPRSVCLILHCD